MARTWSEIRADMDKATAAREAAEAAEARLEDESAAKALPYQLGGALLVGLAGWAFSARQDKKDRVAAAARDAEYAAADERRRKEERDAAMRVQARAEASAREAWVIAVNAKDDAMHAWSKAALDGTDEDKTKRAEKAYRAAQGAVTAAAARYFKFPGLGL